MTTQIEGPVGTFQVSAAIAQHLRVKFTAGKLAVAGAGDVEIGTMDDAAFAADEWKAVRLRNGQGTVKMVAGAAIAKHAAVYGLAGGKIDDVANGVPIGIALEAATADNDVIEVCRSAGGVPLSQASHIADPAGGATVDAEARTAINAILVAIENAGITKTS